MGNENQTLHELIRARKQARPNKQNLDSSDTDSYENTAEFENFANQNTATANLNNPNPNKNPKISRDYDKEPLILRDYSGGALILHYLFLFAFWMFFMVFVSNKFSEYKKGYFYLDETIHTIVIAVLVLFVFLLFDYFNISNIKLKYIYYYASRVVFNNKNNEIDGALYFDIMGKNKIIFCDADDWDDLSHVERESGKIKFCSFLHTIFTENVGRFFLFAFIITNFLLEENGFIFTFVSLLITLFITEILEILVFMGIYKKSNKNLNNFWKYAGKFQINVEWKSNERWKVTPSIHMFYFNQKDHDELKKYLDIVFHKDLDNSNKFFIRNKFE